MAGIILLLAGCDTVKYVPVPEVHTEYITLHDTVRQSDTLLREQTTIIREADSAFLARLGMRLPSHDRIFVIEKESKEKAASSGEKIKNKEVVKTDSIRVPYPVEKKLTRWQRFCCDYGKIMLGATGILLLSVIIIVVFWMRQKKPFA